MRRFKLEHKRQRKHKAVLFVFVLLAATLVYFSYGRPTGFATNVPQEKESILSNALQNEQVMLFIEYHPDYNVMFRELDEIELARAKQHKPDVYGSLEGKYHEIEFSSGEARIIAILDDQENIVKVYNPSVE